MEKSCGIGENIETLFTKLEKFLKTETVIGKPIVIGEITLVPIISVMFGCGSGAGQNEEAKVEEMIRTGLGMGARITPSAILVIRGEEVKMMPVKGKSSMEHLISLVPDIMKKMNLGKKTKEEKTDGEEMEEIDL